MYTDQEIRNQFHETTERRLHDGKLLEVRNSQHEGLGYPTFAEKAAASGESFRDFFNRSFAVIDAMDRK